MVYQAIEVDLRLSKEEKIPHLESWCLQAKEASLFNLAQGLRKCLLRALDLDPHSFSLLDPDPDPGG